MSIPTKFTLLKDVQATRTHKGGRTSTWQGKAGERPGIISFYDEPDEDGMYSAGFEDDSYIKLPAGSFAYEGLMRDDWVYGEEEDY